MRRTLSLAGGLVLGIILSQFPEYAQQYTQRLGGAVDELRVITEKFDKDAAEAGLSREEAFVRYAGTGDQFITTQGKGMESVFDRYRDLSATLVEIKGADAMERLRLLPRYLDSDIGSRTLETYKPAVPVTVEGLAYAGAGFALGYIVVSALFRLLMLPFRRRRVIEHRA